MPLWTFVGLSGRWIPPIVNAFSSSCDVLLLPLGFTAWAPWPHFVMSLLLAFGLFMVSEFVQRREHLTWIIAASCILPTLFPMATMLGVVTVWRVLSNTETAESALP